MFFDRNQDGNCWDSANEALSLEQSGWDYSPRTFETMYLIYLLLIVSGVLQKLIDCLSKGKYTDALKKYSFKQISWLHGLVTFSIMSIVQPNNLRSLAASLGITGDAGISAMKFSLQSVLAFILWDLLIKQPYAGKMIVAINCHHLGLFLAMYFGNGWDIHNTDVNLRQQAHLDSCLYGWMWAIHSFGLILEWIFPLVGIHYRDGERSKLLDGIKHVYSAVTAYWYYQYFNGSSQPGVGLNYQTLSLLTMLCGRFLPNFNVDFLRRVEMPAMAVILVDGVFFKDQYMQRSLAIATFILGSWVFHFCCLKKHTPKPHRFFGPKTNEKLEEFLEAESGAVLAGKGKEAPMKEFIKVWFENQSVNEKKQKKRGTKPRPQNKDLSPTSFAANYPLHYAVALDDAEMLGRILKEGDETTMINEPLLEHYEVTPLDFAADLVSNYDYNPLCLLILLIHGANPYIKSKDGRDCVDKLLNTPLGNSRRFIKKYNEICLQKSPAQQIFSELSLSEKLSMMPL